MATSLSEALEIVVRSDPGVVRSHNEDAVFARVDLGLAILADGIGGYNAGEVASAMAIDALSTALAADFSHRGPQAFDAGHGEGGARRFLRQAIQAVNSQIIQAAADHPPYAGMGTTLVVALFGDNRLTVAHLGDSRLYRLRGEDFSVLTRDHSVLQAQIDSGLVSPAAARLSPHRHLVTRALGVGPVVEPEIHEYPVVPGDLYVLCSDGLNDMVEDEAIGARLRQCAADLEQAAQALIGMANAQGGRDNVSVVLVKVLQGFPASS